MKENIVFWLITKHGIDLLVIVGIIILMYIIGRLLVKYDKTGKVRKILLTLCIEAENWITGTQMGALRKQQVIAWFRERHTFLSQFISDECLSNAIDKVMEYINKFLKNQSNVISESGQVGAGNTDGLIDK